MNTQSQIHLPPLWKNKKYYRLKRLMRELNQLKAELKENKKEIQAAQELVDIKNLAKASLEHASDFQVLLAKYKLVKENQDVLIKVATQNALVEKGSNSGLFFDPKYVIDSVPGSYELEDKSTLALLDSIEKNKEMALTYSLMKNHVNQVAAAYREYHRAQSDLEREQARQKLIDLAGAEAVDEALKDNR